MSQQRPFLPASGPGSTEEGSPRAVWSLALGVETRARHGAGHQPPRPGALSKSVVTLWSVSDGLAIGTSESGV